MRHSEVTQPPIRSEFADDPDMIELIEEFVDALPGRVGALRAAFDRGEIEDAIRAAHQLSGACGGYGFAELGDAARELETRLKEAGGSTDLGQLRDTVNDLVGVCSRVIA